MAYVMMSSGSAIPKGMAMNHHGLRRPAGAGGFGGDRRGQRAHREVLRGASVPPTARR